jgi:hypothetical protein
MIEEAPQKEIVTTVEGKKRINLNPYYEMYDSLPEFSDQEVYSIIHRHIKSVSISNHPEIKATKKIEIVPFEGDSNTYYYSYRVKDKTKRVFKKIPIHKQGKVIKEEIEYYEIEERFTRKYKTQSDKNKR